MIGITVLFYERLEAIEEQVRLIEDLRNMGASGAPRSADRIVLGRHALRIRERLRRRPRWRTIMLDGCYLSIAAEFELAARDLAEWLASALCAKVTKYADLPEKVRESNVRLVGEFLSGPSPQVAHMSQIQVVNELAISLTTGNPVTVFSTGFGTHWRNLRHEMLSEMYSRSDLKDLWGKLGKNPWLQAHLGSVSQTTVLGQGKLDQFMEYRNQIAHRGQSYQTVGPSYVLDYLAFFRCLVGALTLVLNDHVNSFP